MSVLSSIDGLISKNEEKNKIIMAAIDDFKQALEDLKTSVAAEIAAVIAKLAQPNPDDAVLADATAQLTALKATLDTETTALNS